MLAYTFFMQLIPKIFLLDQIEYEQFLARSNWPINWNLTIIKTQEQR